MKLYASLFLNLFGIILGTSISVINSYGQEEKFKALFIYNFTKYIEWPNNNNNDFKIAVIGNNDLVNELNTIASQKKVGTSTINILAAKSSSDITNCQIIFISHNNFSELSKLINKAKSNNILIITESPNSCAQGAALNFVSKSGYLKFEISKSNIENDGLKVSLSLLNLGIVVN